MDSLYARSVFFVRDAQRSLDYYTQTLGFSLDWNYEEAGRPFVFQVSLLGFELILNQAEESTKDRPGHGRVFLGLEDDQLESFRQHINTKGIKPISVHWGAPTLAIRDIDENELFFWLPVKERERLEAEAAGAAQQPLASDVAGS
jgi:catechol 2,3-dioxygenase-like lactoylglutathione lyase family enzyme